MQSLKQWCIRYKRNDILKEFIKTYSENKTIDEIPYNSTDYSEWKCSICGAAYKDSIDNRKKRKSKQCKYCREMLKIKRIINIDNEKNAISILVKELKTSKPEQYIYYYIKKVFPNAIRAKKFDWLGNSEIDIYIPEINFGIEYNGCFWHENKTYFDKEKIKLAKENNIDLFVISEVSDSLIDSSFIYNCTHNYSNINIAINAIYEYINKKYSKNISLVNNINLDVLNKEIFKNLKEEFYNNSLLGKYPEIEDYWNYDKNYPLRPEHITISNKIKLYTKCPFCNETVLFSPHMLAHFNLKNAFAPHYDCKARDEYCLNFLKQYYNKNNTYKIKENSLVAKRIMDWINQQIKSNACLLDINTKEELKKMKLLRS